MGGSEAPCDCAYCKIINESSSSTMLSQQLFALPKPSDTESTMKRKYQYFYPPIPDEVPEISREDIEDPNYTKVAFIAKSIAFQVYTKITYYFLFYGENGARNTQGIVKEHVGERAAFIEALWEVQRQAIQKKQKTLFLTISAYAISMFLKHFDDAIVRDHKRPTPLYNKSLKQKAKNILMNLEKYPDLVRVRQCGVNHPLFIEATPLLRGYVSSPESTIAASRYIVSCALDSGEEVDYEVMKSAKYAKGERPPVLVRKREEKKKMRRSRCDSMIDDDAEYVEEMLKKMKEKEEKEERLLKKMQKDKEQKDKEDNEKKESKRKSNNSEGDVPKRNSFREAMNALGSMALSIFDGKKDHPQNEAPEKKPQQTPKHSKKGKKPQRQQPEGKENLSRPGSSKENNREQPVQKEQQQQKQIDAPNKYQHRGMTIVNKSNNKKK